ncbi:MAG: hypothetical protein IJZ55_03000 [Lachnospiraceae bacterium]|nr:hypothetical protein [Lachnospiraceae bacterium]
MKLCVICDKKIEGKWCKNCKRFVKSYELSNGIYLNESHDPLNDSECTYHDFPKQTTTTYEKRSETARSMMSTVTSNRTGKSATGKRTGKKIAAVIGVFYAVVVVIGIIGTVASEKTNEFEEEIQAEFSEYPYDENWVWTEQDVISSELEQLLLSTKEKLEALEQVNPVEVVEEEEYEIRYYEPKELMALGVPCTETHFAKTLSQFDRWLKENWTEQLMVEEDVSPYYNYYYEDSEYVWLTFSSFRDYYSDDEFAVRANYDTATGQLHMVGFVSTLENDSLDLCYLALKEFDSETDLTEEEFRAEVEEVQETFRANAENDPEAVEYVTIYLSEKLEADCEVKDGMYSITFYPAYTE